MFNSPGSYILASVFLGLLVWPTIGPPPSNGTKPLLTVHQRGANQEQDVSKIILEERSSAETSIVSSRGGR
jgi:hypothetical protein